MPSPDDESGTRPARTRSASRRLRFSLARQGITLGQFAFQLVIVAVGVYAAIVLQDRADRRSREAAAARMLAAIDLELSQDQAAIEQITTVQRDLERTFSALAVAVRAREGGDDVLQRLLGPDMPRNRTFFSRRAAYSTLVSAGHLEYIQDTALRLQLAQVYEHDYVRLHRNGELYDDIFQEVFRRALLDYWDYELRRPISREPLPASRPWRRDQRPRSRRRSGCGRRGIWRRAAR